MHTDVSPTGHPNRPTVRLPDETLTLNRRWRRTLRLVCRDYDIRTSIDAVGSALASFADEDGDSAFPGIPRIARKARLSDRTAGTHLRTLERWGAIYRERLPNNGRRGSRQYRTWLMPPENWSWARIDAEFELPVNQNPDAADLCGDPTGAENTPRSIGKSARSIGNVPDLCGSINRQMPADQSANGASDQSANGARKSGPRNGIPSSFQSRPDARGKTGTTSTGNTSLERSLTYLEP